MWVAAIVLYGHDFWVCLLAGESPCRREHSGSSHMRRVALGYLVKPGGEPCLLVSGGGVIVDGDELQQGPWSVEGCRAAVLARAWSALVIVSDWWHISLLGLVFGDGRGGMVPLDSAGSLFMAVGC